MEERILVTFRVKGVEGVQYLDFEDSSDRENPCYQVNLLEYVKSQIKDHIEMVLNMDENTLYEILSSKIK